MIIDFADQLLKLALQALPSRLRGPRGSHFDLPEDQVYWCDLDLPNVGYRRRQAIALQLDRLSPIRPELAVTDIVTLPGDQNVSHARLYIVRAAALGVSENDLSIESLGVAGHAGVDFLRHEPHRRRRRLATAVACLMLLVAAATAPPLAVLPLILWNTGAVEREVARLAPAAREVRALRDRLAFIEGEGKQASLREARPSRAELIEGLARILPDDVWLTELSFEGGAVHVTGFAVDAGRLPPLIESAGQLRHARFTRPITAGPGGNEQFDLLADEAEPKR